MEQESWASWSYQIFSGLTFNHLPGGEEAEKFVKPGFIISQSAKLASRYLGLTPYSGTRTWLGKETKRDLRGLILRYEGSRRL